MPIYLKNADVAEFADMPSTVAALREAFLAEAQGKAKVVPRTRWAFGERRLNVMGGGISTNGRYALKAYGGGAGFHVLLYSEQQGSLAIMEADMLGRIRTGAATGVASEKMARPGAGKVGLIGTGRQARTQVLALQAVGMLETLSVFGRKRDKLEAFCADLASSTGVPVRAAASGEEAVAGADIAIAATNAATPVLMRSWLAPGAHVVGMGANASDRRELDPQIVLDAGLVVTDDVPQAKIEAAEFIDLANAGRLDWSRVVPLHQVLAQDGPVRKPGDLTVFKSLGVGLEDVAIASLVYDRAMASGRFKPL